MSSNRVGGFDSTDPSKKLSSQDIKDSRKLAPVEKVRAVDEAENERTRKKFQSFFQDQDDDENAPKPPSPFDVSLQENSPSENEDSTPQNYPQNIHRQTSQSNTTQNPLPHNKSFWSKQNTSTKHEAKTPEIKKREAIEKELLAKDFVKKEPTLKKTTTSSKSEKVIKNTSSIQNQALPSPFELEKKMIQNESSKLSEKEKKEKMEMESLQSMQTVHGIQKEKSKPKSDSDDKKGPKTIDLESVNSMGLPPHIADLVQSTCFGTVSNLNPQVQELFLQIVGNIYIMNSKGISITEFALNSPNFVNSRFYGATIAIEKYSTAPDSLNIRLSGSDTAVKAFEENLSSLYAAFQNGNFSFRIGRLYSEYTYEKPIFHRKEQKKGSDGFSDPRENK